MPVLLTLFTLVTLGAGSARIAPTSLAITNVSRDSNVCRLPETPLAIDGMVGTFRLVVSSTRGALDDGLLVLERSGELTLGTLLLSGSPPSALATIVVRDTTLTAAVLTTQGPARIELRVTGDTLRGEIVRGTSRFTIAGVRTN
jgi:hypothetical protein